MNTSGKPKQFLELHGKPILVYTIEQFQQHKLIDGIIVVMLESWIGYCEEIIERYHLTKVVSVVQGGNNGQESIFRGLQKAYELYPPDSIVLIHDGVRPLIDQKTISEDITCVEKHGTAITVAPAIETIALKSETGAVGDIFDRSRCQLAKACKENIIEAFTYTAFPFVPCINYCYAVFWRKRQGCSAFTGHYFYY